MDAIRIAHLAIEGWLVEIQHRLDYAGVPTKLSPDDADALRMLRRLSIDADLEVHEIDALLSIVKSKRPSVTMFKRAGLCFHVECIEQGRPTPTNRLRS